MTPLVWPALAFGAALFAALMFRAALFAGFRRYAPGGDRAFVRALRLPSVLWCVVLGLAVAVEVADMPVRLTRQLSLVLEAAVILSVTITFAHVLSSLVAAAGERRALSGGVTGWAQTSVRLVVLVLGLLVLLSSLGIQITPILTALGVGGLAVALALQDTLQNLFAGMHLLADKPIRVGDYVKLADGVEGHVVDVGWRSTRLRMLQNTVIIVPNHKVAQSTITNYDLPESRMALLVRIGVAYGSDADHVERVLLEEANRAIGEVPGLLAEPKPLARLIPGFGESSLDFTLVCHVASFVDQFEVQHQLRKRVLRRFRDEGITIPFPSRIVYMGGPDMAPQTPRRSTDPG
ncbi:MAG: mechanosensitive ion channel family protein [Candidatus Rokubacteria bacterium]|nr:mechanosensitive ion channel family protein [Candidatus Rokubacteria bacterium]